MKKKAASKRTTTSCTTQAPAFGGGDLARRQKLRTLGAALCATRQTDEEKAYTHKKSIKAATTSPRWADEGMVPPRVKNRCSVACSLSDDSSPAEENV